MKERRKMINSQVIEKSQLVAQAKGQIVSDMGGEKVMLSIQNSKYYNLGEVGGDIWEELKQPMTVSSLILRLTEKYEVEKDVCEQQVMHFLTSLKAEGLLLIQDAPNK